MRSTVVNATAAALTCAVLVLAPVSSGRAHAQRAPDPLARVVAPQPVAERAAQQAAEESLDPRFLASAVLPGAAQYLAGDSRWVPYVAVEAWGWVSYLQQHRSGRDLARRYRDLAWQVARRVSAGERRDTVFEYYEAMAFYGTSGAFDTEPTIEGIQPERRLGTFNGDLWDLARALNGVPRSAGPGTAAYDAALTFYAAGAIRPEYAWAWGASNLEQQVFADLISESDAAFRSATRYLGLILANHIVSAIDALVTARLRQVAGAGLRFESVPRHDAQRGLRWEHGMRVSF